MTEAVLGNAHQVQAHALHDRGERFAAGAVENFVNFIGVIKDERQGNDVQSLVKVGVDQVGVSGEIDGTVADSLDAFGLAAVGQLVHCIDLNLEVAGGALIDIVCKDICHLSPAGGLCRGAAEGQGGVFALDKVSVCKCDCRRHGEDHAECQDYCQ